MIVGIRNNKKVYISFCDDIGDNEGGYFCQVYADMEMQNETDYFTISAEDIKKDNGQTILNDYLNGGILNMNL